MKKKKIFSISQIYNELFKMPYNNNNDLNFSYSNNLYFTNRYTSTLVVNDNISPTFYEDTLIMLMSRINNFSG